MQVIQIHSMGGCGTHLLLELYDSVGIKSVKKSIVLLLAMAIARKDPNAPSRLTECAGMTAAEAVRRLAAMFAVAPPRNLSSDEDCFKCFGHALANFNQERMAIGQDYRFSHSIAIAVPGGKEIAWTVEDRDDAQDMLERAAAFLGVDLRQVALVRNPLDLHYSQAERHYGGVDNFARLVEKDVGEFFSNVIRKADREPFPIVRYEDLCRAQGDKLRCLLADLHFTPEDIARVDTSAFHGGTLDLWRRHAPGDVDRRVEAFRRYTEPFGYAVRPGSQFSDLMAKPLHALRKDHSEFGENLSRGFHQKPNDGKTGIPQPSVQVDDDPELLALMLADGTAAPATYQPTNYWQFIDRKLMPELRQMGLRDFRARHQSPLASAGATDLKPLPPHLNLFTFRVLNNRYTVRIAGYDRWLERVGLAISRRLPLAVDIPISTKKMGKIALDRADHYGAKWRAKPLTDACDSLVGNPEWVTEREGLPYTISFLNKYLDYAYCCPFIDFDSIQTVVELGPGSGRQAEVLKKFHPHLTLYLFDIPPQLYVCEQFLKKVFPDATVGYRETRALDRLPEADGRIYLFSNWKFLLLGGRRIDLFWNAASLQEMEPDVVANYLSFVNRSADAVFLQACMAGKQVARRPDFPGVLKPTTIEDYRSCLADFDCRGRAFTVTAFGDEADEHPYNYENSFWRRRIKAGGG